LYGLETRRPEKSAGKRACEGRERANDVSGIRREKGHMTLCRIEECEIGYGNLDITRGALERRPIGNETSESLKE
jgi:hypothetical protein